MISWMSKFKTLSGNALYHRRQSIWIFLHFEEQLSSICSVYSFPEILMIFVDRMHKKSCHLMSVMYSLKCGRTHC